MSKLSFACGFLTATALALLLVAGWAVLGLIGAGGVRRVEAALRETRRCRDTQRKLTAINRK